MDTRLLKRLKVNKMDNIAPVREYEMSTTTHEHNEQRVCPRFSLIEFVKIARAFDAAVARLGCCRALEEFKFNRAKYLQTRASVEQNANFRLSLRSRPELQRGSKASPRGYRGGNERTGSSGMSGMRRGRMADGT